MRLAPAVLCAAVFACAAAALAQKPEPKYRLSVEAPTKELRETLRRYFGSGF